MTSEAKWTPEPHIEPIVSAVLDDITDRKGFDNVWDGIDDEVRFEIREELGAKIAAVPWVAKAKAAIELADEVDHRDMIVSGKLLADYYAKRKECP